LPLTEKRGIDNGGYCPRITSKAEHETEVLSVLLITMSFNLVRLPEEQGILTNAEEEEEVLLEVITRMVFDAGLQGTAEAVNDSIDIVTSCHHQEPENPKNYTLENLAHNKTRAKQGKKTHTHTHKLSSSLHNPPTTKNQKDSPSVSLATIVEDDSFVCCSRSGSKTAALRGIHRQQEKTLTANRFRIQQPNGTKWRESTKTKPKCLPAAAVTGTSAIRDRKKRNLFDSSSSSSSHSLLCNCRLLIHLSRLMRRQSNLQVLSNSSSRRCLVAILETPSSERQIGERRSGKKREERSCFSFCEKEKKRMRRKKKGEIKVWILVLPKRKEEERKEKKRMRTRRKRERKVCFCQKEKKRMRGRNKREILFLFLLKIERREFYILK
jgi:hypothetical protein